MLLGAGRGLPSQGCGTSTWRGPLPAGHRLHLRGHFQRTNLARLSKAFLEGKRNFIPLAICHEHKNNLGGAHQAKSFCPQDLQQKLHWSEAPLVIFLKGHWDLIAMTPCPRSLCDSWARLPGLSKHFTCTKLPHSIHLCNGSFLFLPFRTSRNR